MNTISEFISSYPTGRWKIENSKATPNNVKNNIRTSEQASADANEKANKNEYVCRNIELDNKEDFRNYEKFENKECRINEGHVFTYIFILLLIMLILFFIFKYL